MHKLWLILIFQFIHLSIYAWRMASSCLTTIICSKYHIGLNKLLESGNHDNVIKWKHFPRYSPFVRSPANSTKASDAEL